MVAVRRWLLDRLGLRVLPMGLSVLPLPPLVPGCEASSILTNFGRKGRLCVSATGKNVVTETRVVVVSAVVEICTSKPPQYGPWTWSVFSDVGRTQKMG